MKKTLAMLLACLLACMAFAFAAQAASAPVFYSDFGARGDGVTDDFDAIIRAHEYANEMGLPVKADPGAVYYIGDSNKTAVIQTDTDWGDARFIVDDDARTTNSLGHLFSVTSPLAPAPVTGVGTLRENQAKLEISLAYDAFVKAIDTTTTRYIRYVPDRQDSYKGEPQYDTFLVDRDGNVDPRTPVIWDFDNITSLTAYPIDPVTLTVRGGRFTTVVNQGNAPYATRNILVERSNVVIDGTVHDLDKEATSTAVYFSGFIDIENCADVTVKNVTVVGHKSIDGYDGYEFLIQHSLNVTILNCRQSNDICDGTLRGITGTNTCKNLVFDTVELNRVDSHKFVTGLTVKNSAVGWHGVTVTGKGTLLMENTKVRSGQQMITLRDDFGSTWNGEFLIRNCEYVPLGSAILVRGIPCRAHDFGYPCAMPEKLTIDGLAVDESELPLLHMGFRIFGGFVTVDQYSWNNLIAAPKHPYTVTREIAIRNLNVKSGLPWILSHNFILFRRFVFPNVKITELAQ